MKNEKRIFRNLVDNISNNSKNVDIMSIYWNFQTITVDYKINVTETINLFEKILKVFWSNSSRKEVEYYVYEQLFLKKLMINSNGQEQISY